MREQQRIADRNIRSGKSPGAEIVGACEGRFRHTQPAIEETRIIVHDLRLAAFVRLDTRIAQDDGLGKRQRRLAEMQKIQESAVSRFVRLNRKRAWAVARRKVLAD